MAIAASGWASRSRIRPEANRESAAGSPAVARGDLDNAIDSPFRLSTGFARTAGRWAGFHEECNRRKRFIFHVRQVSPVVPPHERRIENGQQIRVGGSEEEGLVVSILPRRVQGVARVKLDFLIDDLRLLKLLPIFAWISNFPPLIGLYLAAFVPGSFHRLESGYRRVGLPKDCFVCRQLRTMAMGDRHLTGNDHPQSGPFGLPPVNILSAKIGLDDSGRLRVGRITIVPALPCRSGKRRCSQSQLHGRASRQRIPQAGRRSP